MRLYAEDPHKQFLPSAGLTHVAFPDDVRVDGWIEAGTEISAYYDPLLAKLIVHGETRRDALAALQRALARTELCGIETNLDYLRAIAGSDTFARGASTTAFLSRFAFAPRSTCSTAACRPPCSRRRGASATGTSACRRPGRWTIARSRSRTRCSATRDAAGLEFTMVGATLRFNAETLFVLGGAPLAASLDGAPAPFWQVLRARQARC